MLFVMPRLGVVYRLRRCSTLCPATSRRAFSTQPLRCFPQSSPSSMPPPTNDKDSEPNAKLADPGDLSPAQRSTLEALHSSSNTTLDLLRQVQYRTELNERMSGDTQEMWHARIRRLRSTNETRVATDDTEEPEWRAKLENLLSRPRGEGQDGGERGRQVHKEMVEKLQSLRKFTGLPTLEPANGQAEKWHRHEIMGPTLEGFGKGEIRWRAVKDGGQK